jgi:hypothetical protein
MIMVDQSKRLSQPLRWTRAGRVATIAVGGALVALVVAIVVLASTSSSSPRPGCIEVTFASSLGAAVEHPCGARAREACAHPEQNPGLTEHGALQAACRKAGLPYGRSGGG